MYTITKDGTIAPLGDRKPAKGEEVFESAKGLNEALEALHVTGPSTFLAKAHNSIPGVKPVKKFENLQIGLERTLKACAKLQEPEPELGNPKGLDLKGAGTKNAHVRPPAKKNASPKVAKAPKVRTAPTGKTPRDGSKKAQVIAMLKQGCTREKIQELTGWQAHTVRGFLAILNRTMTVTATKRDDGTRVYKI